jgi:phosphotriesterase-related protein
LNRRGFLQASIAYTAAVACPAAGRARDNAPNPSPKVMTVNGLIDAGDLGVTLTHEHLFADLRPYAEQVATPLSPNVDEVIAVVLPHLEKIRALGCRSLIDCTGTHLGRSPKLIKRLSEASGLHMITATGNYLSAGGRFIPPYVASSTSNALADRWIDEWENGVDGTDIRPGLIKLGVEGSPLTDLETKLIEAAAKCNLRTGLTIAVHTGPWAEAPPGANARSAFQQLDLLEKGGVAPSAWIWTHAQNEKDGAQHSRAARRGGWVSFDGFRTELVGQYVELISHMRDDGLLQHVLISQDAGWFNADQPGGGNFTTYSPLFVTLIPALRDNGFSAADIELLLVRNPAEAFSVRARPRNG